MPALRKSLAEALMSKVIVRPGCWGWTGAKRDNGYTALGRRSSGHRASYILHKGPIPDGLCVLHSCDNRECTNPDHLFLGTQKENTHDAMRKNRAAVGSRVGTSKLTEPRVLEIRLLLSRGWSHRFIARRFGVSKTTIGSIARNIWWRHC